MKVTLGSDHAGFELKQFLVGHVRSLGHDVIDAGTNSAASVDYPDFAEAVASHVLNGDSDRGILICGSGVGASVAINKIPGIRGGLCHDEYSAHQGVEHDDMNVLVLGSRVIGTELARELVTRFLAAKFSHGARHERRLAKVNAIEHKYSRP